MAIAVPPPAPVPGVIALTPREIRLQKTAVLLLTLGPLAGLVFAVVTLWGWGITATDLTIALTTYFLFGFGIAIGYHRLFTHRAFVAKRPIRAALAVLGSMAVEGSVISWVADHRRHHAFADKEGDPHSPHADPEDGVLRSLWHAHIGWLLKGERTVRERWAPDLLKEPMIVRIDRAFPRLVIVSLVLPAVAGLVITGTLRGAVTAFLWGGAVRMMLLHHVTWSINSVCHYFGRRPYETDDQSTNNWPLALISFGESWHNNHHAFPTAAINAIKPWQIDISGVLIAGMEKVGLVSNVHRVTEKQLEKRRS
ncbi:MAG TPA: acyl-CoA desaturase [Actinomycetota bacterium]|nr:acyl-CoA desaturase [Actinomycetota bacterium]